MAEPLHEERQSRHLDRLSEAIDSGTQERVRSLLRNLSAAEVGDLLESLPITKRLAVWELTSSDDVPAAVVIDEAVELAKDYSTERSPAFINGVLDAIAAAVRS